MHRSLLAPLHIFRHWTQPALFLLVGLLIAGMGLGARAQVPDLPPPAAPQADAWNVELVGHTGGISRAVAAGGGYTYLNEGSVLAVLDTHDPQQPQVVGRTPHLPMESVVDLDLAPGLVCVLGYVWNSGYPIAVLSLVDVSNAVQPQQIGVFETDGFAYSLVVEGELAYLGLSSGLLIVDLSDPHAPAALGSYDPWGDGDGVNFLAVQDAYAYLDTGGWLHIVDVSNPANPVEVGVLDQGLQSSELAYHAGTVYVLVNGDEVRQPALKIVDVSNPAAAGDIPRAQYLSHPQDPFQLILIPKPGEGSFSLQVESQASGDYRLGLLNTFNPLAHPWRIPWRNVAADQRRG